MYDGTKEDSMERDINRKKSQRLKIALFLAVFFALSAAVFLLVGHYPNEQASQFVPNGDTLVITNLDVGKADAAIICYNDSTGMVDTGLEEDYELIDKWLSDNGKTSIDYMILTHFDKDHIGSAVKILQKYPVEYVYYPDYVSTKKYYGPLMEELGKQTEGRTAVAVDGPMSFTIDDLEVELFPAEDPQDIISQGNKIDNNMSLMCRLCFGTRKFLFTGDIEKERLYQLVQGGTDHSADWMTFPHHGAYDKYEKDFLKKVAPEYGIISTGEDHLPDDSLIRYLDKKKIRYLMTYNGNITTTCDGRSVKMEQ